MIYLATPYSHPDKFIEIDRFEKVTKVAAKLLQEGHHIISPITHGVPLCMVNTNLPSHFQFWEDYCIDLLSRCEEMRILQLSGWERSRGVKAEIEFCNKHSIPISYINPDDIKGII